MYESHKNILDMPSGHNIMVCLKAVLDDSSLSPFEQELCLEIILVFFENNFIKHLVENTDISNSHHKVLVSTLSQGYSNFIKRIDALVRHKDNHIDLEEAYKDISSLSRRQKSTLLIRLVNIDDLANSIFSYVYKAIVSKGTAEESSLSVGVSKIVVDIIASYGLKDINPDLKRIFKTHKHELLSLTVLDEIELGGSLISLLLECYPRVLESDYTVIDKYKKQRCLKMHVDYSPLLYKGLIHPAVLPMVIPAFT